MKRYLLPIMLLCSSVASAQYWHKMPTQEEIDYYNAHPELQQTTQAKTTSVNQMPADARFPGEYEESQAVAIGWPYAIGSVLDTASNYAKLWAAMADAIQQECAVWIRLKNASDTDLIINYMANRGTPLQQHRFFIYPSNAYWMRDFGPLGFYYSSDDSVGFTDMMYYPNRPMDDMFPAQVAGELGYLNVSASFYAEGGNYMTDGFKRSFHSTRIHDRNFDAQGWTSQQSIDSVKYYWAADSLTVTEELQCDGGTGHIDMYLKLVDEQTFAIMEYPSVVTAADKAIIDSNISILSKKVSTFNKPYRIFKLPMPTKNDGTYRTNCTGFNTGIDNDARTFVNGLLVNKTYIMPAFSSDASGNKSGDSAAVEIFKQILPGYNIVPIDARLLTVQGGALHCVTMQVPAENPLRIWHPAVVDEQPLSNSTHIVLKATNRSGIANSKCNWRKKGATAWQTVNLTDSTDYYIGDIAGTFAVTDTVEYYVSAESNNGKMATKPIASPDGFFTFWFKEAPASVSALNPARNFILNPLPNPGNGDFYIPVSIETAMNITVNVVDIMGRTVAQIEFGKRANMSKLEFNLTHQPAGMYFVQVMADHHLLGSKKVVIQ